MIFHLKPLPFIYIFTSLISMSIIDHFTYKSYNYNMSNTINYISDIYKKMIYILLLILKNLSLSIVCAQTLSISTPIKSLTSLSIFIESTTWLGITFLCHCIKWTKWILLQTTTGILYFFAWFTTNIV